MKIRSRALLWVFFCTVALVPLWAQGQPVQARHAWDRPVGHRLKKHATHKGQQAPPYVIRDVPVTAQQVLSSIQKLKQNPLLSVTEISKKGALFPIYRIRIATAAGGKQSHQHEKKPTRALLSSWIHGNEPAGPVAALAFIDWATKNTSFRQQFDASVLIKVDPWGKRVTPSKKNLNRCFAKGKWTAETRAIRKALGNESFDVFLDLHGSGSGAQGFWLIRGADDGIMSRRILSAMRTEVLWDVPPLKSSVKSKACQCNFDFHALGGITSDNQGTFKSYMTQRGVPYSYTVEAPRNLEPRQQVAGTLKLVRSALYNVARHGQ